MAGPNFYTIDSLIDQEDIEEIISQLIVMNIYE